MDVARAFVYGLLGADYDSSPYTQTGERVVHLAVSGIRLVIDEFRTDVTKPARTAPAAGCGSTTATPGSPTRPSSGYGNSSTALAVRASSMAAGWLSSPLSSTPHGWWFPPASGHTRPAGARTRTTPPKRCASSPGRISRRRWPSSNARSSGRTVTMRPPSAVRSKGPRVSAPPPAPIPRRTSTTIKPSRSTRPKQAGHGCRGGPRRRSGRVGRHRRSGRSPGAGSPGRPTPVLEGCCGSRHRLAGRQIALHEPGFVC